MERAEWAWFSHSTVPGGGFARASVRAAGSATVAGITPDGRPFSTGTMVNDNGTMAIFAAATRQVNPPALLGGELIVADLPTTDVTGEIAWNKPAQLLGARGNYLGGVNTTLVANGSRSNAAIPLNGTGTLTLSGGNFLAPVTGAVEVTAGIPKVPTLGLTGWSSVRLTAGQFRAKIVVAGARAVSGQGLYLPKSKTAWGYFPGTTLGGKIEVVTP